MVLLVLTIVFTNKQREEVVAGRAKRRQQLEKILNEAKETMEDHQSGKRLLEDDEFTTLERKINAYERKLETREFLFRSSIYYLTS